MIFSGSRKTGTDLGHGASDLGLRPYGSASQCGLLPHFTELPAPTSGLASLGGQCACLSASSSCFCGGFSADCWQMSRRALFNCLAVGRSTSRGVLNKPRSRPVPLCDVASLLATIPNFSRSSAPALLRNYRCTGREPPRLTNFYNHAQKLKRKVTGDNDL